MRHWVEFQPMGRRSQVEEGKNLLDAARELGVNMRADCGGEGTCGKCLVAVLAGADTLPPPTELELKMLKGKLDPRLRLACHIQVCGPIEVMVPKESRVEEALILTESERVAFDLEPMVKKYHLNIRPPSLDNALGDTERLLEALDRTYGQNRVAIAFPVLRKLPKVLRDAGWDVTVTVWDGCRREMIDIEPGNVEVSYGVAVDIGTSTVVAYLINLRSGEVIETESMTNPQGAYGEDVMSRISYSMKEKEGCQKMRYTIVTALNQLITKACARARVKPQQIAEATIVGNTVMHHLFLGVEPRFLAEVPFAASIDCSCDFRAQDLGLGINPAGNVHMLPIEAGFVGADAVGVLIATEPYHQKEISLVIDMGTNVELVLGNQELGLVSCSAPAGPALEGAHIRFGMRAACGAIDHLRIDPTTYEVEYHVIGDVPPHGICGSGIIDAIAEMLRAGIILTNGQLNTDIHCQRLRRSDAGAEFVLEWANCTSLDEDIVITQGDVREVQLAKGAINAAIRILMKHLRIEQVERVLLAGAFGSYLAPRSAIGMGLLPPFDLKRVIAIGNAAGYGAQMALLSRSKRAEAIQIARQVRYVELTANPDFQFAFVEGTRFPGAK